MEDAPRRRPGGRSARVRQAVLEAALDALEQGGPAPTLPELAARADVAASSIYRRWGTWEAVVGDALLESSRAAIPAPDTGTLRGDLHAWCSAIADYLRTPRGHALARAAVTVGDAIDADGAPDVRALREQFWKARFEAALPMLERARARGELVGLAPADDLLLVELLVAPLHLRRLLTGADVGADLAARIDLVLRAASVGER